VVGADDHLRRPRRRWADGRHPLKLSHKFVGFGFRTRPEELDQIKSGAPVGSTAPADLPFFFAQGGFYPIVQLYMQIGPRNSAADPDTRPSWSPRPRLQPSASASRNDRDRQDVHFAKDRTHLPHRGGEGLSFGHGKTKGADERLGQILGAWELGVSSSSWCCSFSSGSLSIPVNGGNPASIRRPARRAQSARMASAAFGWSQADTRPFGSADHRVTARAAVFSSVRAGGFSTPRPGSRSFCLIMGTGIGILNGALVIYCGCRLQ